MTEINRRRMLGAIGAATAGAAAASAFSAKSVFASFAAPVPGFRYRKYAGTHFHPRSTLQRDGSRSDRAYFDNGSIFSSGADDVFVAPVELPDGTLIREIQFSYSLTDDVPILVQFYGFDLENNFTGFSETIAPPIPSDPDPLHIRTYTMTGTPVRVDNSTWGYVLRYGPQEPGPNHILWGARVSYQSHEGVG